MNTIGINCVPEEVLVSFFVTLVEFYDKSPENVLRAEFFQWRFTRPPYLLGTILHYRERTPASSIS